MKIFVLKQPCPYIGYAPSSTGFDCYNQPTSHESSIPQVSSEGVQKLCLETVYRNHFEFVYRILRHLGVFDEHLLDVAHDVFLVVNRKLHSYCADSSIRSWLYGIARNEVLHYRRSLARANRRKESFSDFKNQNPLPSAWVPDEHIAQLQAGEIVHDFLSTLDEDKRTAFILHDIEGLSAPEIAKVEKIKLNTVYSRIRKARALWACFLSSTHDSKKGYHGTR